MFVAPGFICAELSRPEAGNFFNLIFHSHGNFSCKKNCYQKCFCSSSCDNHSSYCSNCDD